MDDRIKQITTALGQAADDVRSAFGTMTSEQLNWKPGTDQWSIAQCLDHIIKTNHEFDSEFEKIASGTRRNSFWENWSPFSGIGGKFLIKAVTEDSKKAKAPSQRIVPLSDVGADIVERFVADISDVVDKVEACSGADRQKTVVTSPFLAVFTYKLDDAFTVLVEHSRRHIRQAKRVAAMPEFPRAAVTGV